MIEFNFKFYTFLEIDNPKSREPHRLHNVFLLNKCFTFSDLHDFRVFFCDSDSRYLKFYGTFLLYADIIALW